MITRFVKLVSLFVMLTAACLAQSGSKVVSTNAPHGIPVKNAVATRVAQASPADNGIEYHGGPVLNNVHGTNVYYIWYGTWDDSSKNILTYFANQIGGSPYFNINTTYYDFDKEGEREPVLNKVNFVASVDDHYSMGASLSNFDVDQLVANHTGTDLPIDENAVYFVLTSADVNEQQFCLNACAWHNNATVVYPNLPGTKDIKVALVGNPNQCSSYCLTQTAPSPNNNPDADSMASFVAHELEESVTDPDSSCWYDANYNENADLCVWTFGNYLTLPSGAFYNMKLGNRYYLIQRNWVNTKGGYCALKWDD